MSGDPTRWRDESSIEPELRAAVQAGIDDRPSEAELAMLAAKLAPKIGGSNGSGGSPGGGSGGPAHSLVDGAARGVLSHAPIALAGVLVAATVTLIAVQVAPTEPPRARPDHPIEAVASTERTIEVETPREPAAEPPQDTAVSTRAHADRETRRHAGAADRSARRRPPVDSSPDPEQPSPEDPRRDVPSQQRSTIDRIPSDPGSDELDLVDRAQRSLRSSPADALALAQDHRSRFADGALAQEREVVAIDALVRLARRTEARDRARLFVRRWPSSAHVRRVRTLACGDASPSDDSDLCAPHDGTAPPADR